MPVADMQEHVYPKRHTCNFAWSRECNCSGSGGFEAADCNALQHCIPFAFIMSIQVPHVAVGSAGLTSPRIALGTMGMTAFYNQDPAATEDESLRTLSASLQLGVNHLDTAWVYHNHTTGHHNEELVAKALAAHGRQRFTLATKFFPLAMEHGATEEGIRLQLSDSLRRLGTSYVDLYYMHRVCSKVRLHRHSYKHSKLNRCNVAAGHGRRGGGNHEQAQGGRPGALRRTERMYPQ
jgi:hypothetical protein